MFALLAQISLDQFGPLVPWLAGASLALFLTNQAITFWKDHMREEPNPSTTYALKCDHEELAREFRESQARTDERFTAMSSASSQSREKIFVLIREQNGQLRAEMNSSMAGVNRRLDTVLENTAELRGEMRAVLAKKA
jgi:hypothetical protein